MTPRGKRFVEELHKRVAAVDKAAYEVCGFIDTSGVVYPLGSDTKVLSTVFEILIRPVIYEIAEKINLRVIEVDKQNFYPDFTLCTDEADQNKIALDIKTTYRRGKKFSFTLGGYTSFLQNEVKNILFPLSHYKDHLVIGFIYDRVGKKAAAHHKFSVSDIGKIPVPFSNVEMFINEKWRIASDQAGSGNTTNIGSIAGTLNDFTKGNGKFKTEEEFLEYWRGYQRTATSRKETYKNVSEFRKMKSNK